MGVQFHEDEKWTAVNSVKVQAEKFVLMSEDRNEYGFHTQV